MEKFKFVDIGSEYGGTHKVIAQSPVPLSDYLNYQLLCGQSKDGKIFICATNADSAGDSNSTDDYYSFTKHVGVGSDRLAVIASLRSLADELEKTLNATQS